MARLLLAFALFAAVFHFHHRHRLEVEYVDDVVVVDDDIYEGDIDRQASLTKPLLGLQYIPHAPFLIPRAPAPQTSARSCYVPPRIKSLHALNSESLETYGSLSPPP